jgi:hypothetical protein
MPSRAKRLPSYQGAALVPCSNSPQQSAPSPYATRLSAGAWRTSGSSRNCCDAKVSKKYSLRRLNRTANEDRSGFDTETVN